MGWTYSPSDTAPLAEAGVAAPGTQAGMVRPDHVHPRLSSATVQTTDGQGKKSVAFTRTFTAMPACIFQLIEATDNGPALFKVESWLGSDGVSAWASGAYGGCVVKGYRLRALPVLNLGGIVLIGPLLTALGVLSQYQVWQDAANVQFSCLAIQPSG